MDHILQQGEKMNTSAFVEETDFEKRAQPFLSQLQPGSFQTACFELAGSPYCGKSTTIKLLDDFFRAHGFSVFCPQEGAQAIRNIPRTTPAYNISTGVYSLMHIIRSVHAARSYDIVILDRGLVDAYCWMKFWHDSNGLSKEEMELFQSFFLSRLWKNSVVASYILTADAEVAVARKKQHALSKKQTTSTATIQRLIEIYKKAAYEISDMNALVLIDTTTKSLQEVTEIIITHILNELCCREKA